MFLQAWSRRADSVQSLILTNVMSVRVKILPGIVLHRHTLIKLFRSCLLNKKLHLAFFMHTLYLSLLHVKPLKFVISYVSQNAFWHLPENCVPVLLCCELYRWVCSCPGNIGIWSCIFNWLVISRKKGNTSANIYYYYHTFSFKHKMNGCSVSTFIFFLFCMFWRHHVAQFPPRFIFFIHVFAIHPPDVVILIFHAVI